MHNLSDILVLLLQVEWLFFTWSGSGCCFGLMCFQKKCNTLLVRKSSSCQWLPCGCYKNILLMKLHFSFFVCLCISLIYSFFLLRLSSALCIGHKSIERKTNIQTTKHAHVIIDSYLWVSYPQVLYYLDVEHLEPFSMHENRNIYPWRWSTHLENLNTEFDFVVGIYSNLLLYVRKRKYVVHHYAYVLTL